ncbi:MAG: FAD/NAD(P)-binding protein [Actinobacteria bacterium]|nr:FAD/NAD(P)-binding protein [Actinomycetota bacterium]
MVPRLFRLTDRRQDTTDTFTMLLEPTDGVPLGFIPGQFTMLSAFGVGEVPISVSGAAHVAGPLQHTIRDVGAVTHALAGTSVGDVLGVRGPYGTSWDVADGRGGDVVLVAGGIGLAPLRPAMLEVLAHRRRYGKVVVLYGTRSPQDLLFTDELRHWESQGVEVLITVDYGTPSWTGRVGLVTALVRRAGFDPRSTLALVCGPEIMMRFTAAALIERGVHPDRVRVSLERNMRCGVGLCGHCQYRELFVCVDGPVLPYAQVTGLLGLREV